MKLQPNVIHSQLGMISVRNKISRLKKLCIINPVNEDPRLAVNIVMADKASQTLLSLRVFRCTHVELFKKNVLRVIK